MSLGNHRLVPQSLSRTLVVGLGLGVAALTPTVAAANEPGCGEYACLTVALAPAGAAAPSWTLAIQSISLADFHLLPAATASSAPYFRWDLYIHYSQRLCSWSGIGDPVNSIECTTEAGGRLAWAQFLQRDGTGWTTSYSSTPSVTISPSQLTPPNPLQWRTLNDEILPATLFWQPFYSPYAEYIAQFDPAVVVTPEPAPMALVGGGVLLLGAWRRRRSRA